MSNLKGMKFVAVLAFVGLLTVGLAVPGFAQSTLGVWPGSATGDFAKNSAGQASGPGPSASYVPIGVWPGTTTGDWAKNSLGPPDGPDPSASSVPLGVWPGTTTGDWAKNKRK